MPNDWTAVEELLPLSFLAQSDDDLYRIAQQLMLLGRSPYRPTSLIVEREGRWVAIGLVSAQLCFFPTALPLGSDVSHRAHLQMTLNKPLPVEHLGHRWMVAADHGYQVELPDLASLEEKVRALTVALDGRAGAQGRRWPWERGGRAMDQTMRDALSVLRQEASRVLLDPRSTVPTSTGSVSRRCSHLVAIATNRHS